MRKRKKPQHPDVLAVIGEIQKVYTDTLKTIQSTKADLSRILYLRPSQLPFCPADFFATNASQGPLRMMDMTGAFYTEVGTAVHEVAQRYLSRTGKFLATWECKECGKIRKVSMDNECCDFTMKYHEILIHFKGVVGHIDAIFRDRFGRYWIVDFKTTSVAQAEKKAVSPGASYKEQIETYALYMDKEHGIKIHGVLLMFIRRDNPKDPVMFGRVFTDTMYAKAEKRTKRYQKQHQHVLDITTKKEALALLENGKCKNPFCKTCRSGREAKLIVEQAYERGKQMGYLPLRDLASKKRRKPDQ